jgi:hypothetical protein
MSVTRHNAWTYATGNRIPLLRAMSLQVQALDEWIKCGWESLAFDPFAVFFNTWRFTSQATPLYPRWQQQEQLEHWLTTCQHQTMLWSHEESPTFFVVFESDDDAMLFLLTWGDK